MKAPNLIGGLLLLAGAICSACSITTPSGDVKTSELVVGTRLSPKLTSELRAFSESSRRGKPLTAVFVLDCTDCSSLAAIPLTRPANDLPVPVVVLPFTEQSFAGRIKRLNPEVQVFCSPKPIGLTLEQMSVGSFVAKVDSKGQLLDAKALHDFKDIADIQRWSAR